MKLLKPKLKIKILGYGRALPPGEAVSNRDILEKNPDTAGKPEKIIAGLDARISAMYGFQKRYITRKPWEPRSNDEESSESLAAAAVEKALHGTDPSKLEAFILGSTTTRRYTGSQATSVLGRFKLEAPAYEIKAGCSTSLASLHLSQALLAQGYDNVMVACAETLSKVMHPEVRETWFGLADGGAAIWMAKAKHGAHFEIERSLYSTDGRHVDLYTTPGHLPPSKEVLEQGGYFISGDASQLKDLAKQRYTEMIDAILPTKKERASVTYLIPHQVNRLLIDEVYKASGLEAKILWSALEYGNLGGTSVLFTLAQALEEKRFEKGDRILFMSVGGGLSFASQLWKVL